MASIFDKILSGEIPAYKIAEDDRFLAFLDVFPVKRGHCLVIPKKATDYIFDMDDQELADLHLFAKRVAKAIHKAIPCRKVGMAVVGLEVPHAHIHLIPMEEVGDLNFSNPRLKFSPEEYQNIVAEIQAAL